MSQTVRPQIPPAAPSAPRDWPSDFKDRLTCPLPDFREALHRVQGPAGDG